MCSPEPVLTSIPAVLLRIALLLLALAPAVRADMAPVAAMPDDPATTLRLPPGFALNVFARLPPAGADYFRGPRFMAFGPDGNLYLSLGMDNRVVMLPDADHDGRAEAPVTVTDGLNGPQGLAFHDGRLLVANQDGVVQLERTADGWSKPRPLISNLPTGGHTLKTLKFGPDGHLYLNVGSSCNLCVEQDPLRATLLRYTADGRPAGFLATLGRHAPTPVWATGLRNTEGFDWQEDGVMYATNNGSDMRSDRKGGAPLDDLPPEHFNRIEPGMDYGWPHCWGERVVDPNFPGACAHMQPPALTFDAHAAPLGMTFLARAAFPAEYRDDALVALHGSWNRRVPAGYKLVRVRFDHGKPVKVEDFASGWLSERGAWGRPVDVIVGPDGAVYMSDDRAGMIYRIVYRSTR